MGNCLQPCLGERHQHSQDAPPTNGRGGHEEANGRSQQSATSSRDNAPLNSFLQQDKSLQQRQLARQVSRTTSMLSYKSAQSHFDDESRLSDDGAGTGTELRSHSGTPASLDGSRWASASGEQTAESALRGDSGTISGTITPPDSPGEAPTFSRRLSSSGARSKRRSMTGSLASTFSIRSQNSEPDVGPHEEEELWCHVDPAAFDRGWLAALNIIYGRQAASVAELPLLPVAPWNAGKEGFLGHLTEEQQGKLEALRTAFPESAAFHTDHDLLRFLRARHFDLAATRKLYSKYLIVYRQRLLVSPAPSFRRTEGDWSLQVLDGFPQRPPRATECFDNALRCFLDVACFRKDRLGRPVVFIRIGDVVKHNMPGYVPLADRLGLQSAANELNRLLCAMASVQAGYHIEEIMQVLDLAHVSAFGLVKQMRNPDAQKEFQLNSETAPESFGKVVVINAPTGAAPVWKLAQVFIPPSTREKITICSSDYKAELLKYVAAEDLPSIYGGEAPFEWAPHEPPKRVYGSI